MKKYLFLISAGIIAIAVIVSGCSTGSSNAESATETTELTTENAEDETSLKPKIDKEYKNKLIGTWESEKKEITFEDDNKFTMLDKEGSQESGDFSVVASNDGNMAISLAVEDKDIEVYIAEFDRNDKLVMKNTLDEKTVFVRSTTVETTKGN